jgi:hypothetical protein
LKSLADHAAAELGRVHLILAGLELGGELLDARVARGIAGVQGAGECGQLDLVGGGAAV